ncbi:MAG: putative toxin-antitoxin system toxin component, PIN family [Terracidiphilus sp.]
MSLHVVFDTSTLVSAALRPDSIPEQAFRLAILEHHVFVSRETLGELDRVLKLKKFDRYVALDVRTEFVKKLRRDSVHCTVPKELLDAVRGACRDPKDDPILALGLAAGAEILVSSDQDLLVMHLWRGIRIVTPADFLMEFST